MDNLRVRVGSVAVVLAVAAGCSSGPESASPGELEPSPAPPEITEQIQVIFDSSGSGTNNQLQGLDYEVTVSLGDPLDSSAAACDLAPAEGTVVVPVTLRLVNTHDPDDPPEVSEQVRELAPDPQDPVSWRTPGPMSTEAVGAEGPLAWEPRREGASCTDEPDLEDHIPSHIASQWQYREQVEITGYLTGVPEQQADREGVGLRVDPSRDLWTVRQGQAEAFTVTF